MKKVLSLKSSSITSFLLLFLSVGVLLNCTGKSPVKVGFIADLSSRNAELGIQARNGINLAADEINSSGGIHGRKIEVLVGNHKGDKGVCEEVVKNLIDSGAHIIIGPMVSEMASTVISAAQESDTLVIGPTVSTDALTGIDDNFLRIITPALTQGQFLAQALLSTGKRNPVLILDKSNDSYSGPVSRGFHQALMGSDVFIEDDLFFDGKDDFSEVVQSLEFLQPDAIIFIASGIDTAGIVQMYAKNNKVPQLFGSLWVKLTNVIQYGGKTVEGMIIIDSYVNPFPIKRDSIFTDKFVDLFSKEPNVAARSSYESVQLFAKAYQLTGSLKRIDIKKAILKMDVIEGVSDEFRIDEFGDPIRDLSFFIVENGKYKLFDLESLDVLRNTD